VPWIERFDTLEQLRARIREFARDYNKHWLLERHGTAHPGKCAPAPPNLKASWHDHRREATQVSGDPGGGAR
jgi:hypothetical protein